MNISKKSQLRKAYVSEAIIFLVFSFSIVLYDGFHGKQYKQAVGQNCMADTSLFKRVGKMCNPHRRWKTCVGIL